MSAKQVGKSESALRRFLKDAAADTVYRLYAHHILRMRHEIRVMSVEETIRSLQDGEKSLVRFGDGEFAMMRGVSLALQAQDPELTRSMQEILRNDEPELIVTIPQIFDGLSMYRKSSQKFWKDHLLFNRKFYDRYCISDRPYGSTSFSRPFITASTDERKRCPSYFTEIRRIWEGRHVLVVEGEATHNGVGNNLFAECAGVRRILCPPADAYAVLPDITARCRELVQPDEIVLVSLGPAAKPLVRTLFREGIRVIDIGNLDKEYEWFLQKAEEKCALAKNSVLGREANERAGYQEYLEQVAAVIRLPVEQSNGRV